MFVSNVLDLDFLLIDFILHGIAVLLYYVCMCVYMLYVMYVYIYIYIYTHTIYKF